MSDIITLLTMMAMPFIPFAILFSTHKKNTQKK